MPSIGGVSVGYDVTTPADGESAGLGDDRIRSLKTSLQQALDAEHNFPATGGANTGYHVMGSARPFYGLQSAVSSSGSDGRLMQTSDTSRLFHVGSGGTSLVGGVTAILNGGFPGTAPQRHYWAMESIFTATPGSTVTHTIAFPNSGFSGRPLVFVQPWSAASPEPLVGRIGVLSATGCEVSWFDAGAGTPVSTAVNYALLSIGTRAL